MVIEIALGIVLAVLVLCFLPALIGLGAIAVALVVGALLLYWIGSSEVAFGLVTSAAVGLVFYQLWKERSERDASLRDLKERITRRQSFGYDTTELEQSLEMEISKAAPIKTPKTSTNRRELGYTDKGDDD